jgi:hypothetical protein
MKKLLVATGIIAVLGISALYGSTSSIEGALEATPGIFTIKLVNF